MLQALFGTDSRQLRCDCCQATETLPAGQPMWVAGWTTVEDDARHVRTLCPACLWLLDRAEQTVNEDIAQQERGDETGRAGRRRTTWFTV